MTQTTINVRMDEDLKMKFSKFCENVGLNMSTAICRFAKDAVRNQALPFEVTTRRRKSRDAFWSEANQKLLRESMKEMEETGGEVKEIWMSRD